jgi:hypothetical protein
MDRKPKSQQNWTGKQEIKALLYERENAMVGWEEREARSCSKVAAHVVVAVDLPRIFPWGSSNWKEHHPEVPIHCV